MRLGTRFTLLSLATIVATVAILGTAFFAYLSRTIDDSARQALRLTHEALVAEIKVMGQNTEAMAVFLAQLPAVREALSGGDRTGLHEALAPGYERIKADYGLSMMHIHDPEVRSWLRLHKPDKFGDSLADLRPFLAAVNASRQPRHAIEIGRFGGQAPAVRGLAPIMDGDTLLGTIEVGGFLTDGLLADLAPQGTQLATYVPSDDGHAQLSRSDPDIAPIDAAQFDAAMAGEIRIIKTETPAGPVAVLTAPLPDFRGQPLGAIEVTFDTSEYAAATNTALAITLAAGLGLAVVMAAITWFFAQRQMKPVVGMTAAMNRLAGGETALEIPGHGRPDEIGEMAQAVTVFRDNAIERTRLAAEQAQAAEQERQRQTELARLAAEFNDTLETTVEGVLEAARGLTGAAEDMAGRANDTGQRTREVVGVTRQASENIQAVSGAGTELAATASEITRQVNDSVAMTDATAREADTVSGRVGRLAESAQRIGDVVSLINDIAAQTNLLALNATIEAARAGEAGKGFAVVAGEVKSLANQTAKATEDISQQISAIQQETEGCVASISEITGRIKGLNELSTAIAGAVDQQNAATDDIARNASAAAEGAGQATSSLGQVADDAAAVASAADQVGAAGRGLEADGQRLRELVAGFLADIKAA